MLQDKLTCGSIVDICVLVWPLKLICLVRFLCSNLSPLLIVRLFFLFCSYCFMLVVFISLAIPSANPLFFSSNLFESVILFTVSQILCAVLSDLIFPSKSCITSQQSWLNCWMYDDNLIYRHNGNMLEHRRSFIY